MPGFLMKPEDGGSRKIGNRDYAKAWIFESLDFRIFGFWPSVQDRRPDPDRTEFGPRPVRSIFWDRRSRFGPVDRPSVGLWTSLVMGSLKCHILDME